MAAGCNDEPFSGSIYPALTGQLNDRSVLIAGGNVFTHFRAVKVDTAIDAVAFLDLSSYVDHQHFSRIPLARSWVAKVSEFMTVPVTQQSTIAEDVVAKG
jgi:hypothetical protein